MSVRTRDSSSGGPDGPFSGHMGVCARRGTSIEYVTEKDVPIAVRVHMEGRLTGEHLPLDGCAQASCASSGVLAQVCWRGGVAV